MKILKGQIVAEKIYQGLRLRIEKLSKRGILPTLAVIIIGKDPSSRIYVAAKEKQARRLGIDFLRYELSADCREKDLLVLIDCLNRDRTIHGILIQLPLPERLDRAKIISAISPAKDIDGFGWIETGQGSFLPPTPAGIIELLRYYRYPIKNKSVVIIGSGFLVGQPLQRFLKKLGARIVVCDSKTACLKDAISRADIVVSATGVAGLINAQMIKKGAVVIDVGNTRDPKTGKVVGDVKYDSVKKVAGAITPVPGGVGPVTVAKLIENVVLATELSVADRQH